MLQALVQNIMNRMRRRQTPRQRLGALGESLAARHLRGLGYRIAARNVRLLAGHAPSGRAVIGEIDIIAYDGGTIVFIEVKTRRREGLYPIVRSVDARKRRRIARAARRYRRWIGVASEPYRFDVVTVLLPRGASPRITLAKGRFADPLLR